MDILSYALSKKYTNDTVIGLGAIKGSPATVKSYAYDVDGNTIITFEWTATDNTKRTSTVSVKKGIDGHGIVNAYFNEEGKLVIALEGGETLDPITMPSASVEISKIPDNAVTQKADGIYVKTVDLDGYVEKEDGKSLVLDTDITQISNNKDAIDILNGDNTVDGSVDKKITTAIGGLTKLEKEISLTVPTVEEAKDNVLYLVPSEKEGVYEQWMLVRNEVVSFGNTEIDLSNYVEKVEGKGLSTNDYTNEDKTLVGTIKDKVDKVEGKGLSTNDYTNEDKEEVDSIKNKVDRYATMPTPSSELSGTIVQYVGLGDVYQNGYFYICVQNDLGTWVWREKDVQKPKDIIDDSTASGNKTWSSKKITDSLVELREGKKLTSIDNLDNIKEAGNYWWGASNAPINATEIDGYVHSTTMVVSVVKESGDGNSYPIQTVKFMLEQVMTEYMRFYNVKVGEWRPWTQLATMDKVVQCVENKKPDAKTVTFELNYESWNCGTIYGNTNNGGNFKYDYYITSNHVELIKQDGYGPQGSITASLSGTTLTLTASEDSTIKTVTIIKT